MLLWYGRGMNLLRNTRFWVLFTAVALLASLWLQPASQRPLTAAFMAVVWLALTLLVTPVSRFVPGAWKGRLVHLRRAFGVASAVAAGTHGILMLNGIGWLAGLRFYEPLQLVGMGLGSAALLILLALLFTSTDHAMRVMGRRWKLLHRFVYLAALLVLVHVPLVSSPKPYVGLAAVLVVGMRLLAWWKQRSVSQPIA